MLNEEKVILQLSLKLLRLQADGDHAGLAEMLDDELEAVAVDGTRLDKTRLLQHLLAPSQPVLNAAEIRISILGETALETGILQLQSTAESAKASYSRVWLRHGQSWRLRSYQFTSQP